MPVPGRPVRQPPNADELPVTFYRPHSWLMWFIDRAKIIVKAGDGGRGCAAFVQPPYTRSPFPDGGNGGDGGDVIVITNQNIATLLDFQFRHEFKAERGRHGGGNNRTGRRGRDHVIQVPVGTVIRETETGRTLRDLTHLGEQVIVAKGGRGGTGNVGVTEAQTGTPGETRGLALELKLIAEVGLIGFPNAGKSSLLARISTARPKVAAYPFTTRYPVLGVVQVDEERSFIACDIPGLIEGAHAGRGLGDQFLRHVERTQLLVQLVDAAGVDGREPAQAVRQLNEELNAYSDELSRRPQLVVANKMDLTEAAANVRVLEASVKQPVITISCATGAGIPKLLEAIWQRLHAKPDDTDHA